MWDTRARPISPLKQDFNTFETKRNQKNKIEKKNFIELKRPPSSGVAPLHMSSSRIDPGPDHFHFAIGRNGPVGHKPVTRRMSLFGFPMLWLLPHTNMVIIATLFFSTPLSCFITILTIIIIIIIKRRSNKNNIIMPRSAMSCDHEESLNYECVRVPASQPAITTHLEHRGNSCFSCARQHETHSIW